jgi:hypothetical protein
MPAVDCWPRPVPARRHSRSARPRQDEAGLQRRQVLDPHRRLADQRAQLAQRGILLVARLDLLGIGQLERAWASRMSVRVPSPASNSRWFCWNCWR